ncbi:MAG: FAD-binding oxidoreductase [Oligoflexia bacterium]|nr:FAD-binding oxidoreductase [Oligoflexia bacterium]
MSRDAELLPVYGKDWTKHHAPNPSAVVFPRTTEEVSRFLKLCSRHRVPVVPSGGRTGLAGAAVAAKGEVVLSLDRMNKLGPVDPLAHTVRVQAGVVTEAVHQHCAPHGLVWPVDFASKGSSQVGGNIATNAGGVKVIHYGMTRQWVLGLEVVTMDGQIHELNGALEKNNTGADLKHLVIGSEGTLGVITEATLKLTRLPGQLDVFFFAVDDMRAVLSLFLEARRAPFPLMAFETLSHNCLEASTGHLKLKPPFASAAGAYVLMEVQRPHSPDAQEALDGWLAGVFEKGLVRDGVIAQSPREARELWMIREGIAESLMSGTRFVHKNDVSVPVASLEEFVARMYELFESRHGELEVYLYGHIGDGNLHLNTMKPEAMDREEFLAKCARADRDLFALVQRYRGSVSAEHGIGLLKKDALPYSRTPGEMALLRAIKAAFDPQGLLNPGKIFD